MFKIIAFKKNEPIGVYDSGIGGLSVVRKIIEKANCPIVYFGDTRMFPYGEKSSIVVLYRQLRIISYLFHEYNVKDILIGCNTASVVLAPHIKHIEGVYPRLRILEMFNSSIEQAFVNSKKGDVGHIASALVVKAGSFKSTAKNLGFNTRRCVSLNAQEAINCIQMKNDEKVIRLRIHQLLKTMFDANKNIDVLVLGCSHFEPWWLVIKEEAKLIFKRDINLVMPSEQMVMNYFKLRQNNNEQYQKNDVKYVFSSPSQTAENMIYPSDILYVKF